MKVAKQIADNHVKIMVICPGRVNTKMIKDILLKRDTIPPIEIWLTLNKLQKIYNVIFNQLCYHNGQIMDK